MRAQVFLLFGAHGIEFFVEVRDEVHGIAEHVPGVLIPDNPAGNIHAQLHIHILHLVAVITHNATGVIGNIGGEELLHRRQDTELCSHSAPPSC